MSCISAFTANSRNIEEEKMRLFAIAALVLLLQLGPATLSWADWQGKVVEVHGGGDILIIQTDDNRNITLRLYGIDCPEPSQPFGAEAAHMVQELVVKPAEPITVLEERRDSTGRVLATVVLHDGTTLNDRLLLAGMAWVYPDNCVSAQACQGLIQLENRARQLRRGLWAGENPVPPWQWQGSQ